MSRYSDGWREAKQQRYRAIRAAGGTCYQASRGCGSDAGMTRTLAAIAGAPPPPPALCKRCGKQPVHSSHGACVLCIECAHEAKSIRPARGVPAYEHDSSRDYAMSMDEIASRLGISRELVRLELASAFAKLEAIAPTYLRELLAGFVH